MTAYKERFPAGTHVRIAGGADLEAFRERWTLHNPLTNEQVEFAGRDAVVKEVGFYHGGDPLYTLDNIPGVWHEACLSGCHPHAASRTLGPTSDPLNCARAARILI